MMGRWGLEGMRSFEQTSVARKEGDKLALGSEEPFIPRAPSSVSVEGTQA